jgi:hypothetical protein
MTEKQVIVTLPKKLLDDSYEHCRVNKLTFDEFIKERIEVFLNITEYFKEISEGTNGTK